MTSAKKLIVAARQLAKEVSVLRFAQPVTHVYNPLDYAWSAHKQYLELVNPDGAKVLFMGMNPGPWGMAQTGVPFGHVLTVKEWLAIDAKVGKPAYEHPKRPIEGFDCQRGEVSGERLWGLFRHKFRTPKNFFAKHFITNYCPLVFMEESGRNRTPDKLLKSERVALQSICDKHLADVLDAINPEIVVGVGAYAEQCFQRVIGERTMRVTKILHPSPASPAANRGWAEIVTNQLEEAGVW